jgi:tetratricopeptide (TPR) repeat protein
MRFVATVLIVLAAAWSTFGDAPAAPTAVCTTTPGNCGVSPKQLKRGAEAFRRAVKLQQAKRAQDALDAFEEAARLVPANLDYVTAREMSRQQLVYNHLESGNNFLLAHRQVEALAEFRAALQLDPGNEFALERLRDAVGDVVPQLSPTLQLVAQADQVQVRPRSGKQDFHYRGDVRGLYQQIASQFGLTVSFDDSVVPRNVRFDLQQVNFYTAARLAGQVSRTFWAPVSETEFLVSGDSPENHRLFDRMSMRTFYVSDATTPAELNDLVSTLRGVFDIRLISVQPSQSTLAVRAPNEMLNAATRFLEGMEGGPPQVMLDIKAYEINHTVTRTLGIQLPLQFTLFHLPSAALLALSSPDIQQLINQIVSSGGINQANTQAIQALLQQLQNQQNPLLSQPFATFGGGITRFGLVIPAASVTATFNNSNIATLEHVNLRAMQGRPATLRIGQRFPILNASFAPLLNSPALSNVIQSGTFQPAFPSFTYEDLGLTVKATPTLHSGNDVTLELETAIKALGGQSFNQVPVLTNREYKSTITLENGETAVVASMITNSESRSLAGLPGFSNIPGLGRLTSTENKEDIRGEVLVVITPHVLAEPHRNGNEYWVGSGK